jgi:hypothetical protein
VAAMRICAAGSSKWAPGGRWTCTR